jgi:hypothetical protein
MSEAFAIDIQGLNKSFAGKHVVKTRSAQPTAARFRGSTFMSRSDTSKSEGSMAATVSSPRGGNRAFLPMKGSA